MLLQMMKVVLINERELHFDPKQMDDGEGLLVVNDLVVEGQTEQVSRPEEVLLKKMEVPPPPQVVVEEGWVEEVALVGQKKRKRKGMPGQVEELMTLGQGVASVSDQNRSYASDTTYQ